MIDARDFLASEVTALRSFLETIPEEDILERMSLESRLESVLAELASLPERTVRKANLTFRGKPVQGSRGIAADFAAKAAGAFSDAFTAISAGLGSNALSDVGPIPNKGKNQLLITGVALGSFGFEFELPQPAGLLFPDPIAEDAMNTIESLFRLAAGGSDDDVAEVIEVVHPRAVRKVYDFLDVLVTNQAWCALHFGKRSFGFEDFDQMKRANERLKSDNIRESPETVRGQFIGILPVSRAFEFQVEKGGPLIKGRLDKTIEDPSALASEWLHRPAELELTVIRVGSASPRYTLASKECVKAIEG